MSIYWSLIALLVNTLHTLDVINGIKSLTQTATYPVAQRYTKVYVHTGQEYIDISANK